MYTCRYFRFGGHVVISGCPSMSHLFADTFFEPTVVEKLLLPLELQEGIRLFESHERKISPVSTIFVRVRCRA